MERDEEKDFFEVSMRSLGRTGIPACPSAIRTASGGGLYARIGFRAPGRLLPLPVLIGVTDKNVCPTLIDSQDKRCGR